MDAGTAARAVARRAVAVASSPPAAASGVASVAPAAAAFALADRRGWGRARKPWSSVQPRTPGERTRETWRLRPGFGVVVSLGERDWTNNSPRGGGRRQGLSASTAFGVFSTSCKRDPFRLGVACVVLPTWAATAVPG